MTLADKAAAVVAAKAAMNNAVDALTTSSGEGDEVLADKQAITFAGTSDLIVFHGGKIVCAKVVATVPAPTPPPA